jgi:hypothetical protein
VTPPAFYSHSSLADTFAQLQAATFGPGAACGELSGVIIAPRMPLALGTKLGPYALLHPGEALSPFSMARAGAAQIIPETALSRSPHANSPLRADTFIRNVKLAVNENCAKLQE